MTVDMLEKLKIKLHKKQFHNKWTTGEELDFIRFYMYIKENYWNI